MVLSTFLIAFLLIWIIYLIRYAIRRYFNVPPVDDLFKKNYINKKHKHLDVGLRIMGVVLLLIGLSVNLSRNLENELWYFQPLNILLLTIFLEHILQAIMEKLYVDNPNAHKATLTELFALLVVLLAAFQTNLFGFV